MKVWEKLADPDAFCVAQIAPAVRVAIGEAFGFPVGANLTGKIYAALRRMGFKAVFDTNFGADLTIIEEATEFKARLLEGKGELPLITSCCPGWVDFMEKFHGDMIQHFSSCKSPHAMVGALSKTYYAREAGDRSGQDLHGLDHALHGEEVRDHPQQGDALLRLSGRGCLDHHA